MKNIIITNIGRRGYLVRYLKEMDGFDGLVFVSDCDNTASGLYGKNDGAFILPRPVVDKEEYIRRLLELCIEKEIGIVIPVIDPEIAILSQYRDLFEEAGVFVCVSSEKVLDICYNKVLMNAFLKEHGYLVPVTYESINEFEKGLQENTISFPVIIKPIYGSGSVSTYRLENIEEVKSLFREGMIIQEIIEGQEYGVDTFNDIEGNPMRCVVKKKISMRSGETDKALSIKHRSIQRLMIDVATQLRHIGNLDCDVIDHNGDLYVIDMNPRFGGGYPATHETGVNLLGLVIKIADNKSIIPDFESYEDGVYCFKEISVVSTRRVMT